MPCTYSEIVDRRLEPDFKFFINREGSITERMNSLKQNNNMKNEYLGACLDYIRWGGQTTVLYELGTTGLIGFIQDWMNLNKDNLIWHQESPPIGFILPYISHDKCPRNKEHTGLISDFGGRIRCAHMTKKNLKPNYIESYTSFDNLADMVEMNIWDSEPHRPAEDDDGSFLCDDKELKMYKKEMNKFNNEKPNFVVNDVCYAILNDEKIVLPLEKVLDKLNLEPKYKTVYCSNHFELGPCKKLSKLDKLNGWENCLGHEEENDETVHPFSGWTLALYVQKWYEQMPNGQAPVFEKKK